MAFEPLNTDEKLEGPIKKERDMDTHMLIGCSGFLIAAIGGYLLGVWPYVAIQNTYAMSNLLTAAALASLPQWTLGCIVTRRFGISGACGFVAGSVCVGIFLYLRLQQLFISARIQQSPTPEFPEGFVYMVPLLGFLLAAFLSIAFLPKRELDEIGG